MSSVRKGSTGSNSGTSNSNSNMNLSPIAKGTIKPQTTLISNSNSNSNQKQPPTTPVLSSTAAAVVATSASSTVNSSVPSSFVPHLPPISQLLPGAQLRITTILQPNNPFEAILNIYDNSSNLIIVERLYDFDHYRNQNQRDEGKGNNDKKDYAMINVQQAKVDLVTAAPSNTPPVLPSLSISSIESHANQLLYQRHADQSAIGVGVSVDGQRLFDALRKTMKCEWDGTAFVVGGVILVNSPYTTQACSIIQSAALLAAAPTSPNTGARKGGSSAAQTAAAAAAADVTLNRVRKVLDAERNKLKLNASTSS